MRKEMIISSKGQVTLPFDLRQSMGLKPGDELVWTLLGDRVLVVPKSSDFNNLAGILGTPPKGMATLEEIEETVLDAGGRAAAAPVLRDKKSQAA